MAALYAKDKLNQPDEAEPVVKQLIAMEPNDPGAYFALVKIYEEAGKIDDAEEILKQAQAAAPDKTEVWSNSAQFYNRKGEFDKAMESFHRITQIEPKNPQNFYQMAVFYEEKVRKDFTLKPAQQAELPGQGPGGGRPRPGAPARLLRGPDLQEPAAAAAGGQGREEPGQAAGADQGGGRAPEEGDRHPNLQTRAQHRRRRPAARSSSASGCAPRPCPGRRGRFCPWVDPAVRVSPSRFWGEVRMPRTVPAGWALMAALDARRRRDGGDGRAGSETDRLFATANALYAEQRYVEAAEVYRAVLSADASRGEAHFFLANSLDNLFVAARRGNRPTIACSRPRVRIIQWPPPSSWALSRASCANGACSFSRRSTPATS